MVFITAPIGGPIAGQDRGWKPAEFVRPMTASGAAFSRGDIVQVDTTAIDSTTKAWTSVVAVADLATSATTTAIYGVVLEDIAQNAIGRVGFIGDFEAYVTPSVSAGAGLIADADGSATNTLVASADDRKVVGYALAAINNAIGLVRFNGFGWGHAE